MPITNKPRSGDRQTGLSPVPGLPVLNIHSLLGLTPQAMNLSPLRGWAFSDLALRHGEKGGLNPRPPNPYSHVTGTPGKRKEMCRENNLMMLNDPGSRKTDRRNPLAITGFGARPTLNDNPKNTRFSP